MSKRNRQLFLFLIALIISNCYATIINSEGDKIQGEVIDEIEENFLQVPNNNQKSFRFEREENDAAGSGNGTAVDEDGVGLVKLAPDELATTDEALLDNATTETSTSQPLETEILKSSTKEQTLPPDEPATTALVLSPDEKTTEKMLSAVNATTDTSLEATRQPVKAAEISDHLAFYLGIGAAGLIAAWLILGPIICLIIHARRRWRRRQFAEGGGENSGGWFSRWGRGGRSQRPLINANRAPSPPRLGTGTTAEPASRPLHEGEASSQPTVTISQAYPAQAMTTFSVTNSDETQQQKEPLVQGRSTLTTDI